MKTFASIVVSVVLFAGNAGAKELVPPSQPPLEEAQNAALLACSHQCIDCWMYQLQIMAAGAGAAAGCLATPLTGAAAVACGAGSAGVALMMFDAIEDCRVCTCCQAAVYGIESALCRGGGGDGGSTGGDCPEGTHPGPITDCDNHAPCCCEDEDTDVCGAA